MNFSFNKKIVLIVFALNTIISYGQELVVTEFYADPTIVESNVVKDYNGDNCGYILLGLVNPDASFDGDIISAEYNKGEWKIYMMKGATWITIKTQNNIPLRYEFDNPIQSKVAYIMNVISQSSEIYSDYCSNGFRVFEAHKGYSYEKVFGIQNICGELLLAPIFEEVEIGDGSSVVLKSGDGFFVYSKKGGFKKITLDKSIKSISGFYCGRARVEFKDGSNGFIDEKGQMVIPSNMPKYGEIIIAEDFSNGLAPIAFRDEKRKGKHLWGYIDTNGAIIIRPQYSHAGVFSEGLAAVKKHNNDIYFINSKGEKLIGPLKEYFLPQPFREGLSVINGQYVINKIGDTVINTHKSWRNTLVKLRNIGDTALLNKLNRDSIRGYPEIVYSSYNGYLRLRLWGYFDTLESKSDRVFSSRYGFINRQGEVVVWPQFLDAKEFADDGTAEVEVSISKWGKIDTYGRFIEQPKLICECDMEYRKNSISYFSEGYAVVRKGDLYGYCNRNGEMVIPIRFTNASLFKNGKAEVVLNGETIEIDMRGERINNR